VKVVVAVALHGLEICLDQVNLTILLLVAAVVAVVLGMALSITAVPVAVVVTMV
jgi:hypothetical protein